MTEEEARRLLQQRIAEMKIGKGGALMAESYHHAVEAQRRLMPVTTEAERAAVARYLKRKRR